MTVAGFSCVTIDLAIGGGTPLVTGTRVRIVDVVAMLLRGARTAEVVEGFPDLTQVDVSEALSYATAISYPVPTETAWFYPSDDAPKWADATPKYREGGPGWQGRINAALRVAVGLDNSTPMSAITNQLSPTSDSISPISGAIAKSSS
jgi:uncharacterized protein (DUF433 family)